MDAAAPSPPEPGLATLRLCLGAMQALVEGVRSQQWSAPTPCPDWTVRQLVNHVVMGNLLFAATMCNQPPPDRAADHLGDSPAEAMRRASDDLLAAFAQPGVLERIFPSPLGEQPGAGLVRMRIVETQVHGWDLARATGQSPGFPDAITERTLEELRPLLSGRRRGISPFGPEQEASPDAPAIDRLAAFLGRQVA